MSDADLVARLHAAAEEERLSRHGSGALEDEAAAAIERLTRDLTECQNAALQSGLYGMAECKRLEAERERLSAERDAIDKMGKNLGDEMIARGNQIMNLTAERNQLRELISTVDGMLFDISEHSPGVRRIRAYLQREALAGAEQAYPLDPTEGMER